MRQTPQIDISADMHIWRNLEKHQKDGACSRFFLFGKHDTIPPKAQLVRPSCKFGRKASGRCNDFSSTSVIAKLKADVAKDDVEAMILLNEAYGLTPDEVALLWKTAPPPMPFVRANS